MCFTMGMSLVLSTGCFALAMYEYKCFQNRQYSIGIAYWGVMELLQAIQHLYAADASDNYAMCRNKINQTLTVAGFLHIAFQPLFSGMLFFSVFRRHDPEARIQGDLVYNLCLLSGCWFVATWLYGTQHMDPMPPHSEDYPNYNWIFEGYDGNLGMTTPNLPGKSCTYYAPTKTGHLAWVTAQWKQTYFTPNTCVHVFCMFAPFLAMTNRPFFQKVSVCLWLTGPFLAMQITKSNNEQPAIWCLYSVIQAVIYVVVVRSKNLFQEVPPTQLVFEGAEGEPTLTYVRVGEGKEDSLLISEGKPASYKL